MRKIIFTVFLILLFAMPLYSAEVNEDSTAVLTLTFKDETDTLVVPGSIYYRIDDVPTKTQIRDWTAISPPSSSVDVTITDIENAILKQTHQYEIRLVSVYFTYATGKKGTADFIYNLVNLDRIP
jgi:hypothetical protein